MTSEPELKPFGYPVSWIQDAELLEVPTRARDLLEHYAGIPPSDQLSHINTVRSQALQAYPYPSHGHYRVLDIQLPRSPAHTDITSRLAHGATLLDLGCCIGQELRHLAFTIPSLAPTQLYGLDINPAFFAVGHALFRDADTVPATFLQADVFDADEAGALARLKGKIDIVWTASVIHLWGWVKQVYVLRALFRLLDGRQEPVIAGRMMGFSKPGAYEFLSRGKEEGFYRHNDVSFGELFDEATMGYEGWEVEVEALPWEETLKIRTAEEPGETWDLQLKFVARQRSKSK